MSALKHYKAFISYRHLPLDMKVAKKLHRTIEHYAVPRALRKDGSRRIGYVFRDQDELPISSDLSGSIRTALDNSDFLIVICSPETGKSPWVLEEITYFLRTHDRDHVLAVLISGEPQESFPPMLTEPVTDEDGTIRNIEPLAANIVADSDIKRNRLFKTEVLRILAALIGCAYDDLYKREQRYRIRRMVIAFSAVFAVAACFIGMLLKKNAEINTNYEKALRNQSEYLASESTRLFSADDRFSAIRLALAALPSEDDPDRPVVSKAMFALEQSTLAYYSPSMTNIEPFASLVLSSQVDKMCLNDKGTMLFALTEDDVLSVWDTNTKTCLYSLLTKGNNSLVRGRDCGYFNSYQVLKQKDLLLFHYSKELICIDPMTGDEIWRLKVEELPQISNISYGIDKVIVSYDEETALLSTWDGCYVIRTDNGALDRTMSGLSIPSYTYDLVEFEGDSYIFGASKNGLTVIDSVTGETISQCEFERDSFGTLPEIEYMDDRGVILYFDQRRATSDYLLDRNLNKNVIAIDVQTGNELWRWESGPEVNYGAAMFRIIEYDDSRILVYASGNMIALIDTADGSTIDRQLVSSDITAMNYFDDTNGLLGFTMDGQCWTYSFREDGIRDLIIVPYLNSEIEYGELRRGGYWILPPYSQAIIQYQYFYGDESWQYIDVDADEEIDMFEYPPVLTADPQAPMFAQKKYLGKDAFAYIRTSEELSSFRCVKIPRTLDEYNVSRCIFTGIISGKAYYLWAGPSKWELASVDTASGRAETVSSGTAEEGLSMFCTTSSGELYAVMTENTSGESDYYAVSLSADLEVQKKVFIGSFPEEGITELCCASGDRLIAYDGDACCFVIDMKKKKVSEAPESLKDEIAALIGNGYDPDGRIIWSEKDGVWYVGTDDSFISVIKEKTGESTRIYAESGMIVYFFLSPDGRNLLTVEADSYLRRYSADGKMLGSADLRKTISGSSEVYVQYMDDDIACLIMNGDLRIVSCEDWDLCGAVYSCIGYSPYDDAFICTSYKDSVKSFGFFHRRSLSEMTAYGEEILDGWDLPKDVKKRYGIE